MIGQQGLKSLNLSWNDIGEIAALEIGKSDNFQNIKNIFLDENDFYEEEKREIIKHRSKKKFD